MRKDSREESLRTGSQIAFLFSPYPCFALDSFSIFLWFLEPRYFRPLHCICFFDSLSVCLATNFGLLTLHTRLHLYFHLYHKLCQSPIMQISAVDSFFIHNLRLNLILFALNCSPMVTPRQLLHSFDHVSHSNLLHFVSRILYITCKTPVLTATVSLPLCILLIVIIHQICTPQQCDFVLVISSLASGRHFMRVWRRTTTKWSIRRETYT